MNMKDIHYRTAITADAAEINKLVNSVYRGETAKQGWTTESELLDGIRITEEKIKEIISKDSNVILLVIYENNVIGCVHLEKNESKCHLGMLSVDVNFQNQGLGKIIMEESESYAKNEMLCNE